MITHERLHNLLNYEPETGFFYSKANGKKVGSITDCGYRIISVLGESLSAHRLAWLYVYGYVPENWIDHINQKKDDNRISNLREVSPLCSARNRPIRSDNTSGVVGVCWHKNSGKWVAGIKLNGKRVHLGIFKTKIEAVKARRKAEVEHGFDNCSYKSSSLAYILGY